MNSRKILASLTVIYHQLEVIDKARLMIKMESETIRHALDSQHDNNPTAQITMREFHYKYLARKKACTYYLDNEPKPEWPLFLDNCPYRSIGDMPLFYFAANVKHENLIRVRTYGNKLGEKIREQLAGLGVEWRFGPTPSL